MVVESVLKKVMMICCFDSFFWGGVEFYFGIVSLIYRYILQSTNM